MKRTATAGALAATLLLGGFGYAATQDSVPVPQFEAQTRVGQPYDRDAFPHWTDPDGNGCDTRNDELRKVLVNFAADGCQVDSGILADPYTGEIVQFQRGPGTSNQVQVDHVVPLSWAWRHGADQWTEDQREQFANDPANLVVTVAHANTSKGDSGPADWMPPKPEIRCSYLLMWRAVVNRYQLDMDPADAAVIDAPCP